MMLPERLLPERMMVVWCPDWPVVAAAGLLDTPIAPEVPVVVVDAGRVVACSAAARAEGVRRGLRRRQAEACCPELVVVAADPARDARAFEPVVAAAEQFTPRVEVIRPGVCAFATRGPSRYFGGDESLAASVTAQVDELSGGLRCRVGVADGRFAAERAARLGRIVPRGDGAAFLAPFPVATIDDAGLDSAGLADLLVRLGVRTLGELAALPAPAVLARFGSAGVAVHRLARGLDERPLAARTPPPDLTMTAELDPPAERVETAVFAVRSLAARLHEALGTRGLALTLVRMEAETEHGESFARAWRVEGGTAAALVDRARGQLDAWLTGTNRPAGPVTFLRLVPEEVRSDGGRQEGFWGGDRAAADRAGRAVARVQGRLGPVSVTSATVVGGRNPAEQVRMMPWGDPAPWGDTAYQLPARQVPAHLPPWPGRLPSPAPATVLASPLRAVVVDAAGEPVEVNGRGLASAAPAWVTVGGAPPVLVVAWAGPWPVDERWWDPPAHRRRARWQVVTADGAAHLLVLESGRWLVEATYD